MRVGFHRTFTALSLYFGVRLFVEKCPEILAMSMNIHIAKKKNSVVLPPSFYGGLTWPFHSVMNKGAQATEITWIHGNFRKSLKNTNSRGCFDQFNDPVREPYINGRLLYSVN